MTHLALLDLVLPGSDGIELMNDIRETVDVPVIFLSVYGQDEIVARALDMGAADYLAKPFSPTELASRIRATLRKRLDPFQGEPSSPYAVGGLGIDYALRQVTVEGEPVDMTATEYAVLYELSVHAPRTLIHAVQLQRDWVRRKSASLAGAGNGEEAPPQAGRRHRQPQVHHHRTPHRLPHGDRRRANVETRPQRP